MSEDPAPQGEPLDYRRFAQLLKLSFLCAATVLVAGVFSFKHGHDLIEAMLSADPGYDLEIADGAAFAYFGLVLLSVPTGLVIVVAYVAVAMGGRPSAHLGSLRGMLRGPSGVCPGSAGWGQDARGRVLGPR